MNKFNQISRCCILAATFVCHLTYTGLTFQNKKTFTQMIKTFPLLFIEVFVGVGLGALERLHGSRLWQEKTNKGCE